MFSSLQAFLLNEMLKKQKEIIFKMMYTHEIKTWVISVIKSSFILHEGHLMGAAILESHNYIYL